MTKDEGQGTEVETHEKSGHFLNPGEQTKEEQSEEMATQVPSGQMIGSDNGHRREDGHEANEEEHFPDGQSTEKEGQDEGEEGGRGGQEEG